MSALQELYDDLDAANRELDELEGGAPPDRESRPNLLAQYIAYLHIWIDRESRAGVDANDLFW